MIKVIGIGGSPRKGGNSDILLDETLKGARKHGASCEKIILNDLDFRPCQECGGCDETGVCVVKDDMQSVYKKIEEADRIIIATPIFFGSLSAQIKMMIDRFQSYWIRRYILKIAVSAKKRRKGIFLCVSGSDKKEFFENAKKIIRIFFITLNIEYFGDVFCGGIDEKAAIKKNKKTLAKAFKLGEALVKN